MRRYDCLEAIAGLLGDDDLVVTNLANTATEWHAVRPHEANLYFVGMGMVASYATGLALALPHRRVIALDGDGGLLFDLSVLGTIAQSRPPNLCLIVFDNGGYVSVGDATSTASLTADVLSLDAVARGAGIRHVSTAQTLDALVAALNDVRDHEDPAVIVADVDAQQAFVGASIPDAKENKYRFARHIERTEGTTILRPSAREHGAPAPPDPVSAPVTEDDDVGKIIFDGLCEHDVDFVVGLPSTGLRGAQARCMAEPSLPYVSVANEGTGIGLCAGAWLGGKRPAALVENFGLFASTYQLLRGHHTFGIPTLLVTEYRGDAGDREFFAESGEMTEAILHAMRINHRVVRARTDLKPAIRDGMRWMAFAMRPYAVVVSYDLVR
jgi:sulfopyruvate decarboxylase TPP-binding subunit